MKSAKIKGLALLLALTMAFAMIPVFVSVAASAVSAEPENWETVNELPEQYKTGNLALAEDVTFIRNPGDEYQPHNDATWGWDGTGDAIHDGTLNFMHVDQEGGKDVNGGYHSGTVRGKNHEEYIGYDFGTAKTFDTVIVWPCHDNVNWNGTWYPGMPNCFTVDVSDDGEVWTTVYSAFGYEVKEAGPQTFSFPEVNAQFVRFNAKVMNWSGCWAMKISEMGVYDRDYTPKAEPQLVNYAKGATVTSNSSHNDGPWNLNNINDGDHYNLNTDSRDYGQFAGYHTSPNGPSDGNDPQITFEFAEKTKIDRVVVWPATERFCNLKDAQGNTLPSQPSADVPKDEFDHIYYPSNIVISVSDDGVDFTPVLTITDTPVTKWKIQTYDFNATEAKYLRFSMPGLSGYAKISEIEIYDSTKYVDPNAAVERNDMNLAKGKGAIASTTLTTGNWAPSNLTNGEIESDGGFTTAEGPSAWVGVDLVAKTKFNRLVLYPANPVDPQDAGAWSGVPHSFTVEVSDDNISWRKVQEVTLDKIPDGQTPVTVSFPTQTAEYVRINTSDLYPKPSDSNKTYIQLAELELYYDMDLAPEGDNAFAAYLQTREGEGKEDLRVVLVADVAKLGNWKTTEITVTVTFTLTQGGTKTLKRTLGGAANQYQLLRRVNAAGATYRAADGCALFGNVIINIPVGDYTGVTVTLTEAASGRQLFTASK